MRRGRGESSLYAYLLDEMCAVLGVVGDSEEVKVRLVANALAVPPPESGSIDLDVLVLWEEYARRGNP